MALSATNTAATTGSGHSSTYSSNSGKGIIFQTLESESLHGKFLAKVDKSALCLYPIKFSIKKGSVNKKRALRRLTEGDYSFGLNADTTEEVPIFRPDIEASRAEFEAVVTFILPEDTTPKKMTLEVLYCGPRNSKKKWRWF